MRSWDLTSGAAKLDLARQNLQAAGRTVEEYWTDETRRKFHDNYIESMEPKLVNLLDAIHRLSEVLANADRDCGITRIE